MLKRIHNPDVLSCIASLSSDEVFTSPNLVNQTLDRLPSHIWNNPEVTFLDPFCKSGIFLREITKRLLGGLEYSIPDIEERIKHILTNQVFGIGITELTTLISRRSLYLSKYANNSLSIYKFDDESGNLKYIEKDHVWNPNGKCRFCNVGKEIYDRNSELETYAYSFIHVDDPYQLFNMKFDVIIGNPPYQLKDGGNNSSATPIYNLFVDQAKKLNPKYLIMIIPSRWFAGGRGLDEFRKKMLGDNHLSEIHDFKDASHCFPGRRVAGGVCYFLWEKNYNQNIVKVFEHEKDKVVYKKSRKTSEDFTDIFIRDSIIHGVVEKIQKMKEESLSKIVFTQKPFGLRTNFIDFDKDGDIKVYTKQTKEGFSFVRNNQVTKNSDLINKWKVVTSRSTSVPEEDNGQVLRLSQTFIAEPGSIVTESYVMVGCFNDEKDAINLLSYLKTKFFRVLCQINIVSPDVSPRVFTLVPMQNFDIEWNDQKLFEKYDLNQEEISHIEKLIK